MGNKNSNGLVVYVIMVINSKWEGEIAEGSHSFSEQKTKHKRVKKKKKEYEKGKRFDLLKRIIITINSFRICNLVRTKFNDTAN